LGVPNDFVLRQPDNETERDYYEGKWLSPPFELLVAGCNPHLSNNNGAGIFSGLNSFTNVWLWMV
jgi:hypothetical protein